MNSNEKTILKALIFERLNLVYKTHIEHERKIKVERQLNELGSLPRKERRVYERSFDKTILEIDVALSRIEKQNTELFSKLTDTKVIDFIENCTDLYSEFTNLFVKAYFEYDGKIELRASLEKKVNGFYEKYE